MRTRFIAWGALGALFILAATWWGRYSGHNRDWEAVIPDLPEEVSLAKADMAGVYYVVKQTFEPLFRRDDGQHYTSRLLSDWKRSIDSKEYYFEPNTSLYFNDDNSFSLDYFRGYIGRITAKYYKDFSVTTHGKGVLVSFPVPRRGYLAFLSHYKNAPSVRAGEKVEEGLGPYRVFEIGKNRIELVRKDKVLNGYARIILHQYSGPADPNLQNRGIADFNHILDGSKPKWIKDEYAEYSNAVMASGNLFINHRDKEVRKWLYNCIDVSGFRRAFIPNAPEFTDIQTILPIGVPGAIGGRVLQSCAGVDGAPDFKGPVVLANQSPRNIESLASFASDFERKTRRSMSVRQYTIQQLEKELGHRKKRGFHLLLAVITSSLPDAAFFLEYVCGPESFLDEAPAELRSAYEDLLQEDDPQERERKSAALALRISTEYYILPLYQFKKQMYYPGHIKNIVVGRDFIEVPEVADFRW